MAALFDRMTDGFAKLKWVAAGAGVLFWLFVCKLCGASLVDLSLIHIFGDYEATLFSAHSHNRKFGECYIRGEKFESLAEGVPTVKALVALGKKYDVDLPICRTVYAVLYDVAPPKQALQDLFARSVKGEFDA